MTGVAKNTGTKVLVDLGEACSAYQDRTLQDLTCRHVQADKIWSFCNSKARNVPEQHRDDPEWGDVWTWVAIDQDTKPVPSWAIVDRSAGMAWHLFQDLRERLTGRMQLTTDGHNAYMEAVEGTFHGDVAMRAPELFNLRRDPAEDEKRYSPAKCLGATVHRVSGLPDPKRIGTSHVERQNLTVRMGMRRFTRLINAFSRKLENLAAAVSLHFMYYNFVRPHTSSREPPTRGPPAMAVGVSDHVWKVEEIRALLHGASCRTYICSVR